MNTRTRDSERDAQSSAPEHDEDAVDSWLRGNWPTDADGAPAYDRSGVYERLGGDEYIAAGWRHALADRIERLGVWVSVRLFDLSDSIRGDQ